MEVERVISSAQEARANGASRFCMGAAWRDAPKGAQFNQVLDMVRRKAKPSEQPATSPALVRAASARRDRAAKAPKADAATE